MALTLRNFFGFECGGIEEAGAAKAFNLTNADVLTLPSPAHDTEKWILRIPETVGTAYMYTDYFTPDDRFVWGVHVRFDALTPNPEVDFLCARSSPNGPNPDIRLRLRIDGKLSIVDANGTVVATTATAPFSVNVNRRVELMWLRDQSAGVADVRIDGDLVLAVTNRDFQSHPDVADVALQLTGQAGVATNPTTAYFDSAYFFTGGTGSTSFLGDWEVLGPYQTPFDGAMADNGTDNLDTNKWDYMSDTPRLGTYAGYDLGNEGYRRTNGTTVYGPKYDGRVVSDDRIVGASWLYYAGQGSPIPLYGRSLPYLIASGTAMSNNTSQLIVLPASSSYCPRFNEHFILGFTGNNVRGSRMCGMWGFLLHRPSTTKTTLRLRGNLDVLGNTVLV